MKTFEEYKVLLDDFIDEIDGPFSSGGYVKSERYNAILAIFYNYVQIKTLKANDLLIRFAQACRNSDLENLSEIGKLAGAEIMRKLYELESYHNVKPLKGD